MYEISKCDDNILWDSLLSTSLYSTPYCNSSYLKSTGQEEHRFILSYKHTPVLLTVLTLGSGGETKREFSDYQGLIFLGPKPASYSDDLLRLNHVRALLDFVTNNQETLLFSLNPDITDIRAFQWFAFDHSSEIELDLKVRYTGILDLKSFRSFEDFLSSISASRSKDYLAKSDIIVEDLGNFKDVEKFLELYKQTFASQGIGLKQSTIDKVQSIMESAINHDYGKLRIAKTLGNEPIAGAFFLSSGTSQYYQFGASSTLKSKYPGNSFLLLKTIEESFRDGHDYFDISGLNSPKRGFFKASFGARPKPFYEIVLKRIQANRN